MINDNTILTPAEVAKMFRVNAKTVTRWAREGKLKHIKTLGGHRRYRVGDVKEAIAEMNGGSPVLP